MTDRFPSYSSTPWQPAASPPGPGRPHGTEALALALAVIVVILLLGGAVGVAVTGTSTASTTASAPPGSSTTAPGSSSTTPSITNTAPNVPGPPGIAPVSPLTVPAVTTPPVKPLPLSLSPAVIAARVDPAVVDIDTRLGYQNAIAAGTGMILTSDGLILTNNHVINGATTIGAISVRTGQAYTASVVGVDPTADVAVLQLNGASGLATVATSSTAVIPGAPVVAIGNAGGAGGTPSVTEGTVEAIDQAIVANDPAEGTSEQLTGLIETNATLQPGDSGGPLVDGTGQVIGMDTAASVPDQANGTASFAIPIATALGFAHQIRLGQASATVHLGLPPFLGVQVTQGTGAGGRSGALVTGLVTGGPAAGAGVAVGSLIVAINGQAIGMAPVLATVLRQFVPGDPVTVSWIDRAGVSHSARVVLGTGPAD